MKYLRTIAILLLLFGLPAGSWYFLKDGLNWRKGKMETLKPKERFLEVYDFSDQDKTQIFEELSHRTAIIKLNSDITKDDMRIIDQFDDVPTFMFFVISKNVRIADQFGSKVALRYIKPSSISSKNFEYNSAQYVIVDTSGYIRNFYPWDMEDKMKNIVEDIAVILPRKVTPDIVVKENN